MPRVRDDHAQALRAIRGVATRLLPPDQLARALLQPLERVIGWDGYRLFGVDPDTLLINRLLAASEDDRAARLEWLEKVYLDEKNLPYLQVPALLRSGLPSVAFLPRQDQSWGYPPAMLQQVDPEKHRSYYFESESPVGGVVQAVFEANGRKIAVLQVNRRDPGRHFRPEDVQLLRLAAPIVGHALGQALARLSVAGSATSHPSGVIMLRADRSILLSTSAAEEWFERLHALEPQNDAYLPTALWSVSKGFSLQSEAAMRMSAETSSGPVTLEASDGGDGSLVIIISPQSRQTRPEPPAHWGLTTHQAQIVMHVIAGATNREIARRLYLSENTVEWHMRKIFRALDLSSRIQLQSRFFRESGLGSYVDLQSPNK